MATTHTAPGVETPRPLAPQLTWWVLALPAAFLLALATRSFFLLDYAHVLSGALWTGADLFLGFILGPVMRRLPVDARRSVISYLVPRTLLFIPVVAATTASAGWYLSTRLGYLASASPMRPWVLAALAITAVLAIQGLGVLLPNNLRIWYELRRPEPDVERVTRLNRQNLRLSGLQGLWQVLIILVMAHLAVG